MILTTTSSVDGRRIRRYLGIVTGEAILGPNLLKDLLSSVGGIVGRRSAAYEQEMERARCLAFAELQERGEALGANAVIGVDIDYQLLGGMLMVSVSGTAVDVD